MMYTKFDYYRYLLAEKMHKLINFVLRTTHTSIGWGDVIDKEDQEQLHILADKQKRLYELVLAEQKDVVRKRQLTTLLYTLKQDEHYEEIEEIKENGDIIIGLKLKMLGLNAKSIKNEIEQYEQQSMLRGNYKEYKSK